LNLKIPYIHLLSSIMKLMDTYKLLSTRRNEVKEIDLSINEILSAIEILKNKYKVCKEKHQICQYYVEMLSVSDKDYESSMINLSSLESELESLEKEQSEMEGIISSLENERNTISKLIHEMEEEGKREYDQMMKTRLNEIIHIFRLAPREPFKRDLLEHFRTKINDICRYYIDKKQWEIVGKIKQDAEIYICEYQWQMAKLEMMAQQKLKSKDVEKTVSENETTPSKEVSLIEEAIMPAINSNTMIAAEKISPQSIVKLHRKYPHF
jgi:hypothetical protein